MLALGTKAPEFSLPDTDGKIMTLKDFANSRALLVIFMCNHCPFVIHVRGELVRLANDYAKQGLAVAGINSNNVISHPDDSPERMKEDKAKYGYPFPYLYDESQAVAKAYRAACTPDFFLFDAELKLVYRGQLDDSRPGNSKPVTGRDLRAAIEAVLAGNAPSASQTPSIGCNIKWKPGNEPDYYGR